MDSLSCQHVGISVQIRNMPEPQRLLAHRIRIYPTAEQALLLLQIFGCCRFLHNLALEQRQMFGRRGRSITFRSWSDELKALKAEAPFLRDAPHHCLLQALKDLDAAYARFFTGEAGYPKPWKKFQSDSCRFPDPKQFSLTRISIKLPKLGVVKAKIHRPILGDLRSITINREGGHWYASVLTRVQAMAAPARPMLEGGYDVGVKQAVVESDGTVHAMPVISDRERERKKRLQQAMARRKKGSARRARARTALRALEARMARRRRAAAHRISSRLVDKYSHLACEDLKLRNMTASARGTAAEPGRRVAQKAGLNRSILEVAPGMIRRMVAYKAAWRGTTFVAVNPWRTSQICSECERHPADAPETAHLRQGRISRDRFVCPLCGYAADADHNAARNIRARGRLHWSAKPNDTVGPTATDRGAFCMDERVSVRPEHGREAVRKIPRHAALRAA